MKNKRGIVIILVLFAAIVLWWLWPRHEAEEVSAPGTVAAGQNTNAPGSGARHSLPPPELIPEIIRSMTGERQRQRERDIESARDEWRTPIEFYGKAVDENGQPVEGVAVTFGVTDLSTDGHSTYHATSDAHGLFSLRGVRGKHLSIKLHKPGYYVSRGNPAGFFYAGRNDNFVAIPNEPVLFHFHQHGQAEPLIIMDFPGFARIAQLPRNGTPMEFDLVNGTTNTPSGGHVQFEFRGDPISRETKRFNWQLHITAPGGLLETNEEFPFLAPEDGYSAEVEINYPVTLEDAWQTTIEKKYFIRLNDGRYGRVEFRLLARNGVFTMQSYLNPSGSPNLEYSEAAQAQLEGVQRTR